MLLISSSEDRYGLSDVLVSARVLPPPRLGAPLAPFLVPSSAFPLKRRSYAHHDATSSQATHPTRLPCLSHELRNELVEELTPTLVDETCEELDAPLLRDGKNRGMKG